MMMIQRDDVVTLATDVFGVMLKLPLVPVDLAAASGRSIEGCVHVTGAYAGAVVLQCTRPLAERVARIMFSINDTPTLADIQDAFGEITNMVGGTVKALCDGECFLSLPSVVEGSDYSVRIPGTAVRHTVAFDCQGEPLFVHVLAAP